MSEENPRWNHNIHYHRVVLEAAPARGGRAVDLGCGEGELTRRLAEHFETVVGVDLHGPSVEHARSQDPSGRIDFRHADLMSVDLELASFDLVASIATVHHLDLRVGLERMRELVRPGGLLVVVGCARSQLPHDLGWELAGTVAHRWNRCGRSVWQHPSPTVWPPAHTHLQARETASQVLPGCRFRRHLLWRYSLVWRRAGEL